MDKELLKGHLPILVLGLLNGRPMHGYALAKEIKQRGSGRLPLGEGTLYPLLYRLEGQGDVDSSWEMGPSGKQRKIYRLTESGKRRLEAGRAEWLELRSLIHDFLGGEWGAA